MDNAQQEPSMEEILASIRRIISEDEEEAAPPQAAAPSQAAPARQAAPQAPVREAEPAAPSAVTQQEAVIRRRASDNAQPHIKTEDVEMIKKNPAAAVSDEVAESFLDSTSADAAAGAFQALSDSVRVSDGPGRTLEDLVVEMLQPMVKDWLDANLPAIVEEKVEEEVQRVARRRR